MNITKHVFLESRKCLTQGWYLHKLGASVSPSDAKTFRLEQGLRIGQIARELYPSGILIYERCPQDAAKRTASLLTNPTINTIFEAAFLANGCVARADILTRGTNGWMVGKVKSALRGTKPNGDLIDDVAYTTMVAKAAGLEVDQSCLLLISRNYRKGMSLDRLLVREDVTSNVSARLDRFRTHAEYLAKCVNTDQPPQARLCGACRHCEFFATECVGKDLRYPIIHVPRLHRNRLSQLVEMGVVDIHSIPKDFRLSDTQAIAVDCVTSGCAYVGPTLAEDLDRIEWPVAYLDFETVTTAVPLYPDVAPHQQVPTQFSVHVCDKPGHAIEHHEYLADPACDCRPELVNRLLAAIGDTGSVIVYHAAFERGRIMELTYVRDDRTAELEAVVDRLFDLEVVIRRGYYHPDFQGSYSIKRVLPVIVVDLSYKGLSIDDGDTAVAKFARMALGQYDADEVAVIRQQLLDYCRLDTYAMVRLHERLLQIAASIS